jgi:hypothetical protein
MTTHSITFNNTRYHQHPEMAIWLEANVGAGGWSASWDNQLPGQYHKEYVWRIESMFGNTTFAFKHEKDYAWFLLRWA